MIRFVLAFLLLSAPVFAQTPVNGTTGIAFAASPDHNAVSADGTPLTDHYQLDIVAQINGALFWSQNLLKPNPDNNGEVLVRPIAVLGTLPYGAVYTATVSAVGPGGSTRSAASDPFVRPAPPPAAPRSPGSPRVVN